MSIASLSFPKALLLATTVLTAFAGPGRADSRTTGSPGGKPLADALQKLPIVFEPNRGQAAPDARFVARGEGYVVSLTADGAILRLKDGVRLGVRPACGQGAGTITGVQPTGGFSNYLVGDRTRWITQVPHYRQVQYLNACPGVDITYYGNPKQLEYDLAVAPSTDARALRMAFTGARAIRLAANGDLVISTGAATLIQPKPRVFQTLGDRQVEVAAGYRVTGRSEIAFNLGPYDKTKPLIIDPVLVYSTYLGGSGGDFPTAVALDAAGNAYIAGTTLSTDFPTITPVQSANAGGYDVFVTKVAADGSSVLYSTYLGGEGTDAATSIAVDSNGNAYVAGETNSATFPTTSANPTFTYHGNYDGFVFKLAAAGNSLIYSNYLGGSGTDDATGIAIDGSGNVYLAGWTNSMNFPTTASVYQPTLHGAENAFTAKLDASGTTLVYSTYLGGSQADLATAIAVDSLGNVFLVGATSSDNFPTTGGVLQTARAGLSDAFLTKLNSTATGLLYSTFLGGSADDVANAIAVDSGGNAYLSGTTTSSNFHTANPLFTTFAGGTSDAFIAKVNSAGTALVYSTYLGGSGTDIGSGIAIDGSGNAYVVGQTTSTNLPLQNALYTSGGVFVTAMNAAGTGLLYSTHLAGNTSDAGTAVKLHPNGSVYVTGYTSSEAFPLVNALKATLTGGAHSNGFLTVLSSVTSLSISKSHAGVFAAGQNGATYTVVVSNGAAAPASSGTVTVTETVPTGLTLVSMAGTGWTCPGGNTCTRSDALAPGASYPPITVTVNVSPSAPATMINRVTVSGGGAPSATATDWTSINGISSLGVTKTHTGNFTQGQTGALYVVTVSNSGTAATSGTVSVTDTVPTGLTLVLMSGTGWSCSGATCTRSDALAPSASYPQISVFVNVAGNAAAQVTNQVAASGGGSATANASDPTTIGPASSGPPQAVSITPSSGTTAAATLQLVLSHPAGFANLSYMELVINNSLAAGQGCYLRYERAANRLYLLNDAGSSFGSAATPGAAGTLSNTQCSVNVATTTVNGSGNTLTLTAPITFTAAFAGNKNMYLWGAATDGQNSGYQLLGTWSVPGGGGVPAAVSVTPSSGSTSTANLQFVVSHGSGFTSIGYVEAVINSSLAAANGCYLRYERAANRLYLLNDAGSSFGSPATPGVAGTLSNTQCSVNAGTTTVVGSGNNLTITAPITFNASFAGSKNVYLWAASTTGQTTAYQLLGTWSVPGGGGVPAAVSVTPSSGSGASNNFQFIVSHGSGFASLAYMEVVINNSLSAANGCYLRYERAANRLYLLNDAGSSFGSPATPGVAGTLSNTQCSVNVGSTTVAGSGNMLTMTAAITFNSSFAGNKNVYLWAASTTGQTTSYQLLGTWTVPGSGASPTAVSVTPSSGSTTNANLQFVVSHPSGFANISYMEVVINNTLTVAQGCYIRYERAANRLYLLNDAGNAFTGPATPGVAGTLSNTQCSINVGGVTVVGSGNNLTLTTPVTFSGTFHGTKTIYLWGASVTGQTSGYQALGTWTLP